MPFPLEDQKGYDTKCIAVMRIFQDSLASAIRDEALLSNNQKTNLISPRNQPTKQNLNNGQQLTIVGRVWYTGDMKNMNEKRKIQNRDQSPINEGSLPREILTAMIEPLSVWYAENKKPLPWRASGDPYHIWLSEIMLQQTRTTAVIPYYHRFVETLPTVEALAEVDSGTLMKLWEGLGYYSRARNLKAAAIRVVEDHGGRLPADYNALLSLPGIGEYTAGAIGSIAFGLPRPAVDGNVLRVIMRLCGCEWDVAASSTKKAVTEALADVYPSGDAASVLTQAIMELGENICIPNGRPRCIDCPLSPLCQGLAKNTAEELPRKSPKKPRRILKKTVLMIEFGDKIVIRRRPEKGLLAGLWEFPCLDGQMSADEALAWAQREGLSPIDCSPCGSAVHVFTHVEWHMSGLRLSLAALPAEHTAATPDELTNTFAIPKAFAFFKEEWLKKIRSSNA